MNEVTIVICYQSGTSDMLRACLTALDRYTQHPIRVMVLTQKQPFGEEDAYMAVEGFALANVHVIPCSSGHVHGKLLDAFIPKDVGTELFLTLDSDCFPVADGWLGDLVGMLKGDVRISGILHPWAPPPDDMDKRKLEWRVRSQHCWNRTHVACQLMRKSDFIELGHKYDAGDDTGLAITAEAARRGWAVAGFKPTRCPRVAAPTSASGRAHGPRLDPEFNRYVSVVYGDKVYHHGGFTRQSLGDEDVFKASFGHARERVLVDGAEFLLDDLHSYRFKFDREEEVAQEKMQRLFGLFSHRMEG